MIKQGRHHLRPRYRERETTEPKHSRHSGKNTFRPKYFGLMAEFESFRQKCVAKDTK